VNARDEASPLKRGGRAEAQRARILAAAEQCFIAHGFHAATMASIAQTAKMSPGLMYRYFPSKHAIVLAIIERQLEQRRVKIAALHSTADIAANIVKTFAGWRSGDPDAMNIALFLSMSADASRDSEIAQALHASDLLTRADLEDWLARSRRQGGRGVRKDRLAVSALMLQCIVEGLAIRAVREPELDLRRVEPALRQVFDVLLAS
jgi:AcrR family transcriptional regulator